MRNIVTRSVQLGVSLMIIGQILANASYARVDPGSIVGIWLLDEGDGDVVRDISGNKNDGKVFGAKWTEGKFGKGLEFDGTSHVRIPPSAAIDNYLDGFTYLLWVKPLGTPGNVNVRLIERDWHNPTIQIGPADFYGSIIFKGGIDNSAVRGGTWKLEEWSFVALTFDGTTLRMYVDDKMVKDLKAGKPDFTKAYDGGSVWLAQWKIDRGWDFTGAMDEVGIFNVALGEDDIKSIRNNGLDKALGILAVSNGGRLTVAWGYVKSGFRSLLSER